MPEELPPWLQEQENDLRLLVLVAPRASRTRAMGVQGDRLKIQLTAPPVDGKANDALVRFVAKVLDVPRARVEIVSGQSSRRKAVRVSGVSAQQALLALSPSKA